MTVKVDFDTTEYEFAHGRKPKGYGSWAFSEERNPDIMTVKFWPGTYTQAKQAAAAAARAAVPADAPAEYRFVTLHVLT